MSENDNQTRNELLTIRAEISKTNEDLSKQISDNHDKTIAAVDKRNAEIKQDVRDSNKETRDFIKWAIALCAVFIIALCVDHIDLKNRVSTLTYDFGTILLIAPNDHSEAIQFDVLKNRYNPTRGKQDESIPDNKPQINQTK